MTTFRILARHRVGRWIVTTKFDVDAPSVEAARNEVALNLSAQGFKPLAVLASIPGGKSQ